MTLDEFIQNSDVDYAFNRVSEDFICKIEEKLGVKLGSQLKRYILEYGYLGYKHVELFGVNAYQKFKSDMLAQTIWINDHFKQTTGLIAIEDQGDGDYYLADSSDRMYRFVAANNELTPQNIDLFEYILKRFAAI